MATPVKMASAPTISSYIKSFRNETITFEQFYLQQVVTFGEDRKGLLNFDSLLVKYMPEIRQVVTKVELPIQQYMKYRFNPKLLSYDLYGTTELWALILDLNELHSAAEFDLKIVKLPNEVVLDRLSRILNLEQMAKDYNAEQVAADLTS